MHSRVCYTLGFAPLSSLSLLGYDFQQTVRKTFTVSFTVRHQQSFGELGKD